jgi:hypothetical protein
VSRVAGRRSRPWKRHDLEPASPLVVAVILVLGLLAAPRAGEAQRSTPAIGFFPLPLTIPPSLQARADELIQ